MQAKIRFLDSFKTPLFDSNAREKVLYGGSGSGKTHSVQQYAILKALNEPNDSTLIIMETIAGVKTDMLYPMRRMLSDLGIPNEPRESVPINITLSNGHKLWFSSADDPEKLKYFTNVKRVIINEATALSEEDFNQLRNRMGRTYDNAEIILTFNPIDAHHWLVERYVNPFLTGSIEENITVHHSTYRDNPFLTKTWVDWLKGMELKDSNFYRVYALGQPGRLEGLVFNEGANWIHKSLEAWGWDISKTKPTALGMDWGWNDPTTLVAYWDHVNGNRYAHCFIYKPNMTPPEVVNAVSTVINASNWTNHVPILCDPSRPENIELLKRAGFSMADKANNDIGFGIGMVKDKQIIVSDESLDLIRELRNYRWMEKDGRTVDKPVDEFNHAIDAMRYAIATGASEGKPNAGRLAKLIIR